MESVQSDDLDGNSIAKAVLQGITDEDFSSSAVDALLSMVQAGHTDVLGDVLAYLAQHQHPDWAAELSRMVMAGPDGAAEDRDFATVAAALTHMVQNSPLIMARKVCTYILQIKDNGQGGSFFDCYDISFVLGHMVQANSVTAAGQILYDLYCDDSDQGRMYQSLVPHVLGTLIDKGHSAWAVELGKQLMYADGERSIDYSAMGWAMAQMVYCGRPDWPATLCNGMLSQHLRWYNQNAMMQAVTSWGDPSFSRAIMQGMAGAAMAGDGRGQQQQQQAGRGSQPSRSLLSQSAEAPAAPEAHANGDHGLQSAMEGLKVTDNGPSTPPRAAEPAAPAPARAATPLSPLAANAVAFVPGGSRADA